MSENRTRPSRLPVLTELIRGRRGVRRDSENVRGGSMNTTTDSNFVLESPISDSHTDSGLSPSEDASRHNFLPGTLKAGDLIKTSKSRSNNKIHGPPRKRKFRVSEEALEYFQLFSHVKVKKTFPITSIQEVRLLEDTPDTFQVVFQNLIMELEAISAAEASDWVSILQRCVSEWNEDPLLSSISIGNSIQQWNTPQDEEWRKENISSGPPLSPGAPPISPEVPGWNKGGATPIPAPFPVDDDPLNLPSPSSNEKHYLRDEPMRSHTPSRTRSKTMGQMLKTWSTEDDMNVGTYGRRWVKRKSVRRKLRLVPKLEKQVPIIANKNYEEEERWRILHEDFAMIKYPRSRWGAIPSEKIFCLDKDNLQIMWRKNASARAKITSTLRLDSILEIRLGQKTDGFQKFPYDEVACQSFSLVYEDLTGKYAKLGSLDLISDHPIHFEKWVEGLESLHIGPQTAMFPTRYENTDPILIWLKRLWTCCSVNHELGEKDSIKIMKMMQPSISSDNLKQFLVSAHSHQHEASIGSGHSLRWDGFILLYNLLVGETGVLNSLYRSYAKTHKRLGLTIEEFKEFLIQECKFSEEDCQRRRLKELIAFHDHHHLAFKKFSGNNKPANWKITTKLLSYTGLLSFLRSKHNATVNPLHDTIYQDMDQPLSHYFINCSHNTYLEADQIKGRSTLDAYTRSLVQGCRCVEIDCWDNTIGKEPVIYHGFTFTSKLALRDVIKTINKYAFHMSHYPVIISIENHCNEPQQARMARVFREEFCNELGQCIVAIDDLVEGQASCRYRLPSPNELQGMILLKGSYKTQTGKTKKAPPTPRQNSSSAVPSPILRDPNPSPHRRISDQSNLDGTLNRPIQDSSSDGDLVDSSPTGKGQWAWPDPDKPINKGSIVLTRGRTRREARKFSARVKETEGNIETIEDDQELAYTETSEDLRRMIVYCRGTRIKPWSWAAQQNTSICQMFSFGEISATNHYKKAPKELLKCTERQLVRTYPKGARIDSSNYNPVPFWNHGIQMTALNFQTPDVYMHLNQGRFRQNGGCGYVLKPEIMRRTNLPPHLTFDPRMTKPHPLIPTCSLDIELMNGLNLRILGKSCISLSVQISTHGIPADSHSMEPAAESNDLFCPNWPTGTQHLTQLILMPELCLVYFRVEVAVKASGRTLYAQNCIALSSLQPGIKFIQLRKTGGELIPESGLFVKIQMDWNRPSTPSETPPPFQTTPPPSNNTPPSSTPTPPPLIKTPPPRAHKIRQQADSKARRSHMLVHQEGLDVTQSLLASGEYSPAHLRNDSPAHLKDDDFFQTNDVTASTSKRDSISLVNLLEVDGGEVVPVANEGVELIVVEGDSDTETQTATLEVEAEIEP